MTVFLSLGEVTFANNEVPENVNFGGGQALSVKQLVGGQRIIDAMGRVDDDIHWSGMFFGSTALFRARFLDGMRVAGAQLNLTWSSFNYLVVIKEFKAQFDRDYQIPYNITLSVVQDLNQPFPILLPVAYNDIVTTLFAEANDVANAILNPSVTNAIALVAEALNNFDLSNGSLSTISSIMTPLAGAGSVVGAAITSLSGDTF